MVDWILFERGGKGMKRLLTFNLVEGVYTIQESSEVIFSIDGGSLQFDSHKFYEGIFKGKNKSTRIEFQNIIENDKLKKGNYIFSWLTEIFNAIQEEFQENEEEIAENNELNIHEKVIILYDIAACAGNGFFVGDNNEVGEKYVVNNEEVDFAVRISGHSMEPYITDKSIVLVKKVDELESNDIGIFVVDSEVMCKSYIMNENQVELVPLNNADEYKRIVITSDVNCVLQGKVIEVIKPS